MPIEDAVHEVYKHRLSPLGTKEGYPQRQELGDTIRTEKELNDLITQRGSVVVEKEKCGNCYGAGSKGQCCNTCQDVKDAYARLGWRFKPQGIVQCATEASLMNLREQNSEDGGCQIYGRIELNKAAGHFHIAPHKKMHETNLQAGFFSLLDLISFTFDQFNISHTVNALSFGDQYPGIKSPLDGQSRIVTDTHGMHQYYIKVVPTKYKAWGGSEEVSSNQYSVTEHCSHLAPASGRGLPGVYFYYEVSPIQARIEVRKRSLFRFLTSLCAIVGGAFSLMGLVDLVINSTLRYVNKRNLL